MGRGACHNWGAGGRRGGGSAFGVGEEECALASMCMDLPLDLPSCSSSLPDCGAEGTTARLVQSLLVPRP